MFYTKPFVIAFLLLFSMSTSSAQENVSALSSPIDIPNEGWNKVLPVSNGNTLLFHFELRKNPIVKIFDKTHKEIASKKADLNLIDVNQLDKALLEGLYDVGGEAVLFVTQQVDNVRTLVRVRFDSNNGAVISEDRLVKSGNFTKETVSKVFKNINEPGYHVTCYAHAGLDTATDIKLINYNEKHEVVSELPYMINSNGYDFVNLVNSGIDRTGNILICTELSKIIQYPELNEHTLMLFYLPKGEGKFVINKLVLPQKLKVVGEDFTINSFAGKINMFVDKLWDASSINGVKDASVQYISQSMFIIPEDISGLREAALKHDIANMFLCNAKGDTGQRFYGSLINRYTNDAGKTTVIFEDKTNIDDKTMLRNANIQCAADLCIAQYNDEGKEIWSAVLPKAHYYAPVTSYPRSFGKTSEAELFTSLCLNSKRGSYILFNDPDENFTKTLSDAFKPIFTYEKTNAVYYHVNRKNEVAKKYLPAKPADGEYQQLYPGSAHFDDRNNTITALVKHNKGKESTMHIVWTKLEE